MKFDALGLAGLFVATLMAFSEALAAGTDDEFEAMPDLAQVNEPGRTLWINWKRDF